MMKEPIYLNSVTEIVRRTMCVSFSIYEIDLTRINDVYKNSKVEFRALIASGRMDCRVPHWVQLHYI